MTAHIEKLGDDTSHDVKPDFESGKGYYWMKQTMQAQKHGWLLDPPRKPRRTLKERSFFDAVDKRLSRSSSVVNISFDEEGKRIKE
jgi:hypothetical protein